MIRDAASGRPPGARLLRIAAAALLLSVSLRGSAQAVAEAAKAQTAAAEPKSLAERLPAAVSDAQKLVAAVRAVPFPGLVPSALLPEKELAKVLEQKLSEDLPVPFDRYAASLAALGVVPAGADLKEPMTRLYARQVAGFYDPDEKKFYVVPERAGEAARGAAGLGPLADRMMEDALLTHELTHALQDRHLDLSKRLKALREDSDAQMALQAMLEGEATVVMMQAVLSRLPVELRDRLSTESLLTSMAQMAAGGLEGAEGVPEFFVKELLFPYTSGTEWVEKKRADGGWAALDAAWKRPPETTAEILHPGRPASPRKRIPDAGRPAAAEIPPRDASPLDRPLRRMDAPDRPRDGRRARARQPRRRVAGRPHRLLRAEGGPERPGRLRLAAPPLVGRRRPPPRRRPRRVLRSATSRTPARRCRGTTTS